MNKRNKEGYTAITIPALHHRHKGCVEHMLKHPSADCLHLDYFPGDNESTVREISVETYPGLQPPLPESLDSSGKDIQLLVALQRDKHIFSELLYSSNPKNLIRRTLSFLSNRNCMADEESSKVCRNSSLQWCRSEH